VLIVEISIIITSFKSVLAQIDLSAFSCFGNFISTF
jgi:hypothetical protein